MTTDAQRIAELETEGLRQTLEQTRQILFDLLDKEAWVKIRTYCSHDGGPVHEFTGDTTISCVIEALLVEIDAIVPEPDLEYGHRWLKSLLRMMHGMDKPSMWQDVVVPFNPIHWLRDLWSSGEAEDFAQVYYGRSVNGDKVTLQDDPYILEKFTKFKENPIAAYCKLDGTHQRALLGRLRTWHEQKFNS